MWCSLFSTQKMFYIWSVAMGYLFHLILFAVVLEKGKQEADCPEAKATVFTHLCFCYHDNMYYLWQLKPVLKYFSSPNSVYKWGWNSILSEPLTRFRGVFSAYWWRFAGAAGRDGCWEDAPTAQHWRNDDGRPASTQERVRAVAKSLSTVCWLKRRN